MPIIEEIINPDSVVGIWKIEESVNFFLQNLNSKCVDEQKIERIRHPDKKLQHLSSRLLIQTLAEKSGIEFEKIIYLENKKIVLENSCLKASVSHSGNYSAAIISEKNCGIDIETHFEKAHRLRNKFLNDVELKNYGNSISKTCICWSAKESIFKADLHGKLIFKIDMVTEKIAEKNLIVNFKENILKVDYKQEKEFVLSYLTMP